MDIPSHLAASIAGWERLSRWERAELGRALRRLGWSYGEIGAVLPVPKATLAGWCRGIALTDEQAQAIRVRTGSRKGVPRDRQRKRRAEVARLLSLFVAWVRAYLVPQAVFVLSLHLHEGNDEAAAREYWAGQLGLGDVHLYKTSIKPGGTGHRTNKLEHGVCRVLVRRSTNAWIVAMERVDFLADRGLATLPSGR